MIFFFFLNQVCTKLKGHYHPVTKLWGGLELSRIIFVARDDDGSIAEETRISALLLSFECYELAMRDGWQKPVLFRSVTAHFRPTWALQRTSATNFYQKEEHVLLSLFDLSFAILLAMSRSYCSGIWTCSVPSMWAEMQELPPVAILHGWSSQRPLWLLPNVFFGPLPATCQVNSSSEQK